MSGWAECGPCGLVFAYDEAFDEHRVGEHEFTYSEGLKMNPPREDGRRCLTVKEMEDLGWKKNKYDRWQMPAKPTVERVQTLERVEL